jgi:hypothetical protein
MQASLFFTRAYCRFFRVAFSDLTCPNAKPATSSILAFRKARKMVDCLIEEARLAA